MCISNFFFCYIHLSTRLQQALCAFAGESDEELSFPAGAEILVLQQPSGGWWEGKYNGRIAWFPSDFVEKINRDKAAEAGGSRRLVNSNVFVRGSKEKITGG